MISRKEEKLLGVELAKIVSYNYARNKWLLNREELDEIMLDCFLEAKKNYNPDIKIVASISTLTKKLFFKRIKSEKHRKYNKTYTVERKPYGKPKIDICKTCHFSGACEVEFVKDCTKCDGNRCQKTHHEKFILRKKRVIYKDFNDPNENN